MKPKQKKQGQHGIFDRLAKLRQAHELGDRAERGIDLFLREGGSMLSYPEEAGTFLEDSQLRLIDGDVALAANGSAAKPQGRRFTMRANSGKPIENHWFWGNLGIDLAGIRSTQPRLPVLLDHDPEKRIGFTESLRIDKASGYMAEGQMLTESSPEAQMVIAQSKDGFPWQASVRLKAGRIQLLDEGEEGDVNGFKIEGPGAIFRESELREVTFTALGADSLASAATLSAGKVSARVTAQVVRTGTMTEEEKQRLLAEQRAAAEQGEETQAATAVADPQELAAAAGKAAKDAVAAERARVKAIKAAADPSQAEIVQQLIDEDVSLAEALPKLNADMRTRLKAAQDTAKVAATASGAGNRDTMQDGTQVQLEDPEQLKQQFYAVTAEGAQLRREFMGKPEIFLAYHRNKHRNVNVRELEGIGGKDRDVKLGAANAIGYRGIKGSYWLALETGEQGSWVDRIATRTTTAQLDELFKWLGNPPLMAEWTGMRQREQLRDYGIRLINKKYTATIEADVDDLRRDGFGMIPKRVAEMGAITAALPERLITTLLEANPTAYDGIALFSNAGHVVGGNTVDNLDTATGGGSGDTPTAAEAATAILAAIKKIMGFLDDRGNPMNANARTFGVMVAPKYLDVFIAALNNAYLAAGTSNTVDSFRARGFTINLYINPLLTQSNAAAGRRFYTWREDGGINPLIWQEETIPDGFRSLEPSSDGTFWTEQAAYGSKRICVPGPGRFEYIHRTEFQ